MTKKTLLDQKNRQVSPHSAHCSHGHISSLHTSELRKFKFVCNMLGQLPALCWHRWLNCAAGIVHKGYSPISYMVFWQCNRKHYHTVFGWDLMTATAIACHFHTHQTIFWPLVASESVSFYNASPHTYSVCVFFHLSPVSMWQKVCVYFFCSTTRCRY